MGLSVTRVRKDDTVLWLRARLALLAKMGSTPTTKNNRRASRAKLENGENILVSVRTTLLWRVQQQSFVNLKPATLKFLCASMQKCVCPAMKGRIKIYWV